MALAPASQIRWAKGCSDPAHAPKMSQLEGEGKSWQSEDEGNIHRLVQQHATNVLSTRVVSCQHSAVSKAKTAGLSISGCASSFSWSPVSGSAISRSTISGSASSWST